MKINSPPEGEEDKQCKDCEHFKPTEDNKGNCFGHEVSSEGSAIFSRENNYLSFHLKTAPQFLH